MPLEWISHRGESADAPENTIPAFKLARERRTDGSECDVHLTADGQLAVCHDDSTERMGDRKLVIAASTAAEISSVNVAGPFKPRYGTVKIPFLPEVFKCVGTGRRLYIELKNGSPRLADAVRCQLRTSGLAPEQVVIISFDAETCTYAKRTMPAHTVLWLTSLNGPEAASPAALADRLRGLGVDGIDAWSERLTPELAAAVKTAGGYLAVWTVDDADTARRMISYGVDAITSNRAAALRKELQCR